MLHGGSVDARPASAFVITAAPAAAGAGAGMGRPRAVGGGWEGGAHLSGGSALGVPVLLRVWEFQSNRETISTFLIGHDITKLTLVLHIINSRAYVN